MGRTHTSRSAGMERPLAVASLNPLLRKVLNEVRFTKRNIGVSTASSYTMYMAGDDGAKGFTAVVNLDTNQYDVTWGAWGGGGLGTRVRPVDDVKTPSRPLTDNLVIVQGQIGSAPYASIRCSEAAFPRLVKGESRMANTDPDPKGHNWIAKRDLGIRRWIWTDPTTSVGFSVVETDDSSNEMNRGYSYLLKVLTPEGAIYRYKDLIKSLNNAFQMGAWSFASFKEGRPWLTHYTPLRGDRKLDIHAKSVGRVAAKYMATLKSAELNPIQVLTELFKGHFPFVRDSHRFVRELVTTFNQGDWDAWGALLVGTGAKVVGRTSTDYESDNGESLSDVKVSETVKVTFGLTLNFRTFPRMFTMAFQGNVLDKAGFMRATSDLLENREAMLLLSKLWKQALRHYIEDEPLLSAEIVADEITQATMDVDDWGVQYTVADLTVSEVTSRIQGAAMTFEVDAMVSLKIKSITPPERDYDDSLWRD